MFNPHSTREMSGERGMIPQPPVWETGALPIELPPQKCCLHIQAVILHEQTNHVKGDYDVSL